MPVTQLAPNDPDRDMACDDNGNPYIDDFTTAFGQWVYCQEEEPTIEHAAMCWNATPDVIRQAINEHAWIFECEGRIECEGL